jgi:hypothetical protein
VRSVPQFHASIWKLIAPEQCKGCLDDGYVRKLHQSKQHIKTGLSLYGSAAQERNALETPRISEHA